MAVWAGPGAPGTLKSRVAPVDEWGPTAFVLGARSVGSEPGVSAERGLFEGTRCVAVTQREKDASSV